MTAVGVLTRRFLLDYGRNPVNLVVLILIPVVFVWVAAEPMADAAKLLGGTGRAVETATTGWAAAFLAALAMFSTLADALRDALKQDLYYPAVATLMVTVYFPNFFHVSSSFWGLVLGTLFYLAYSKKKLG